MLLCPVCSALKVQMLGLGVFQDGLVVAGPDGDFVEMPVYPYVSSPSFEVAPSSTLRFFVDPTLMDIEETEQGMFTSERKNVIKIPLDQKEPFLVATVTLPPETDQVLLLWYEGGNGELNAKAYDVSKKAVPPKHVNFLNLSNFEMFIRLNRKELKKINSEEGCLATAGEKNSVAVRFDIVRSINGTPKLEQSNLIELYRQSRATAVFLYTDDKRLSDDGDMELHCIKIYH